MLISSSTPPELEDDRDETSPLRDRDDLVKKAVLAAGELSPVWSQDDLGIQKSRPLGSEPVVFASPAYDDDEDAATAAAANAEDDAVKMGCGDESVDSEGK